MPAAAFLHGHGPGDIRVNTVFLRILHDQRVNVRREGRARVGTAQRRARGHHAAPGTATEIALQRLHTGGLLRQLVAFQVYLVLRDPRSHVLAGILPLLPLRSSLGRGHATGPGQGIESGLAHQLAEGAAARVVAQHGKAREQRQRAGGHITEEALVLPGLASLRGCCALPCHLRQGLPPAVGSGHGHWLLRHHLRLHHWPGQRPESGRHQRVGLWRRALHRGRRRSRRSGGPSLPLFGPKW